MRDRLIDERLRQALSLEAFLALWAAKLAMPLKGLDKDQRKYVFYSRYNWERQQRTIAAYRMSDSLARAVDAIEERQDWVLITEDWCVDSAYALPVIQASVARNPLLSLHILPRDANLDVMDRYLTNGARSIPRLVVFGEAGRECFIWGPAPDALIEARNGWKAAGVPGPEISQRKVDWYEARGWDAIDAALASAIATSACVQETL
ncbi:MAG: thioredoxin family protein [Rhodothermales bacterium]